MTTKMPLLARTLIAAATLLLAAQAPSRADPGDALDTGGGGISQYYVLHATQAQFNGHFTEALSLVDHAIALFPNYIYAHLRRADILSEIGTDDEAIIEMNRVIAAHPEYAWLLGYRGVILLDAGKVLDAIKDFDIELHGRPAGLFSELYASSYGFRSLAYEKLGMEQASLDDLILMVKEYHGLEAYSIGPILGNRCHLAAMIGLLDSAVDGCDEAIEKYDRNDMAYEGRAIVALKRHDWAHAIADYTKALYYRPEKTTALYGRGVAELAQGNATIAATDMAKAAAGEPHIDEIMTRLGLTQAILVHAVK